MGAADDRVAELLDRWLASVELHARYLALDDAAYAAAEDWPRHQRPTRWLVDIARARCEELKRQLQERRARNDEGFADALELMAFLTNLMGSEHVERFIPLATGRPPKRPPVAPPVPAAPEAPTVRTAAKPPRVAADSTSSTSTTGTVELPKPASRGAARARSSASATGRHARSGGTGRHARPQSSAPRRSAGEPARPTKTPAPPKAEAAAKSAATAALDPAVATVIADAVRMLNWGREWPQLAGLIARLAGRPPEADVWQILRRHRATIEAKVTGPAE